MIALRRYTNLAAAIHLLHGKRITLLNPATWDDKNDAYFMSEYKRRKNAETVLALCFAESQETYHHWKVFSNGSDGVCIVFDKDELLSTFRKDPQIKRRSVKYKRLNEIRSLKSIKLEELPFLKRYPYEDEREYRVVYVDTNEAVASQDYPIEIGWIERVVLSPWMSRTFRASVAETLKSIKGCSGLKVTRSTLIDNDSWKNLVARVSARSVVPSA